MPARDLRTDIQALRAVAVLAVLGNHLWPERLPGGYIGVDIFFVVSGFLITSHLLREHESTGGISLPAFWARRARRLLPAALLVLLVSAVIAVTIVPVAMRQDDLAQLGWSGLYLLNWALVAQSLDYFAQETGQTLVVHYWSLSVEEQFYLIWPVILVMLFFVSRGFTPQARHRLLIGSFAGAAILSFAWALFAVSAQPQAAYFQTTARAWEFAAGGLLALAPSLNSLWQKRLVPLVWLAWGALAVSLFVLGPASGVPGWAALLPVLATIVVIRVGEPENRWSPRVMTSPRPVQVIGDLSYAMYLWHFPLIVGGAFLLERDLRVLDKLVILLLTVGLAYLTKKYVEDPIRFGALAKLRPRLVIAGTLLAALIVGGGALGATQVVEAQAQAAQESLLRAAEKANPCFGAQAELSGASCPKSHILADPAYLDEAPIDTFNGLGEGADAMSCADEVHAGVTVKVCTAGVPDGEQKLDVALVGDSHLAMWRAAIRNLAAARGMRLTIYTTGGCPPSLDDKIVVRYGSDPEGCSDWRRTVIHEVAENPEFDVVITASRANTYRYADETLDPGTGYVDAWRMWLDAGKSVIAIDDVPQLEKPVVECITEAGVDSDDPCARPRHAARPTTPLRAAAEQMDDPRFHFADYIDLLCDEALCHAVVGGIPAYQDANHLSVAFALSFGESLLREELDAVAAQHAQ